MHIVDLGSCSGNREERPRQTLHALPIPRVPSTGFTLIELLVVVAIIGVIMGIFLPALAAAREAAKSAVCTSNLRQIHLATINYAAANHDRLPPKYEVKKVTLSAKEISEGKRLNTLTDGIQILLARYAEPGNFQCPGDVGSVGSLNPVWSTRGTSYDVKGADGKVGDLKKYMEGNLWNKLDKRKDLATDLFKPWEATDPIKVAEKTSKGELGPTLWHGGRHNLVFMDGHVATVFTKADEQLVKGDD